MIHATGGFIYGETSTALDDRGATILHGWRIGAWGEWTVS